MVDTSTISEKASSNTFDRDQVNNDEITDRPQSDTQSTTPISKQGSENQPETAVANDLEPEYISGIPLYLALGGITAVAFLIMLDQTIVVTVS